MNPKDRERREARIAELTEFAARDPGGYRRGMLLVAACGYLVHLFLLLAFLMLTGMLILIAVKKRSLEGTGWLIVLGGMVSLGMISSLLVRSPAPIGIRLREDRVPKLFKLIEEVREELGADRIHQVYLTGDMNAGVEQLPALGLFFAYRNRLHIGLPLLQASSVEEFRSVVLHELAHIGGNHARFTSHIYRLRGAMEEFAIPANRGGIRWAFAYRWFLRWYFPVFDAWSFVLCRQHEFEADRVSAEVMGSGQAARSLARHEVWFCMLEREFSPDLYRNACQESQPPKDVFFRLREVLRKGLDKHPKAACWLRLALANETEWADTHPSLLERLEAIGYAVGRKEPGEADLGSVSELSPELRALVPVPVDESAEAEFLASEADALCQELGEAYAREIESEWASHHHRYSLARDRLQEMESRGFGTCDNPEHLVEMARLYEAVGREDRSEQLYRRCLDIQPENGNANFGLGSLLLDQDPRSALQCLDRASRAKVIASVEACTLARAICLALGDRRRAREYLVRREELEPIVERLEWDLSSLRSQDRFEPSGLSPQERQRIAGRLSEIWHVNRAYLVRRRIDWEEDGPFNILAVEPRFRSWTFPSEKKLEAIHKSIDEKVGGENIAMIFLLYSAPVFVGSHIKSVPGSVIFDRKTWERTLRQNQRGQKRKRRLTFNEREIPQEGER